MYAYRFLMANGEEFNFKSRYYLGTLNVININGARVIGFSDVEIFINLIHVMGIWIDGMEQTLIPVPVN